MLTEAQLTTRIARLATLHSRIEVAGITAVSRLELERGMILAHRSVAVEEKLNELLDEFDRRDAMRQAGVHVDELLAVMEATTQPEPEPEPRQHADGSGFTPFAWRHLLHDTGFASDHASRPYIFVGSKPRVSIETRTTLTLAFQFYVGREDVTHLWVLWSDGKRHLVHRKGC